MDLKHLGKKGAPAPEPTKPPVKETALYNEKDAYAAIIRSKILDEDIIVLKDKKMLKKLQEEHPGVVIYSPAEINEMERFKGDHDAIRKIHNAKKMFEGRLHKNNRRYL
ncbi:MAG: hypothetical protein KAS66_00160 [Candidatus Omnitrophica bacterium]|nr:hypothetical protein [Candidatus Omnitrophota bacterium]